VNFKDIDSSKERSLKTEKSASFNTFQSPDDGKKSDFIRNLNKKPETVGYKIYGIIAILLVFFLLKIRNLYNKRYNNLVNIKNAKSIKKLYAKLYNFLQMFEKL